MVERCLPRAPRGHRLTRVLSGLFQDPRRRRGSWRLGHDRCPQGLGGGECGSRADPQTGGSSTEHPLSGRPAPAGLGGELAGSSGARPVGLRVRLPIRPSGRAACPCVWPTDTLRKLRVFSADTHLLSGASVLASAQAASRHPGLLHPGSWGGTFTGCALGLKALGGWPCVSPSTLCGPRGACMHPARYGGRGLWRKCFRLPGKGTGCGGAHHPLLRGRFQGEQTCCSPPARSLLGSVTPEVRKP